MNKLKDFAGWLNRIGYLQKSKEPFTVEVLEALLPEEIKQAINTDFSQDTADKGLVHLLKNDDVQPIYSQNDTLIVVEQLREMVFRKWGAVSKIIINGDAVAHIVKSFEGDLIAVKLRYKSAEAWKVEMVGLSTYIAKMLLNTPVGGYEVHNRNAFAMVNDQTTTYRPQTPFFVLTALRTAKGIQATIQNSPNNRYTGTIDELSVIDVDLDRNILTMIVKSSGEALEVICTPTIMYCTTTGAYIHDNGRAVPETVLRHPIYTDTFNEVILALRDQFRSLYTKSAAYIDGEVALTDEKDIKRMERMIRLFEAMTDDRDDIFTTYKGNKLHLDVYNGKTHTIFEVTPTYILDTMKMMIVYVRTPQMTQTDIEAKLQKNLGYYPHLSSSQAKIIFAAFIQGYDLRRSVKITRQ